MKKIAFCLILALVLCLFVACSSDLADVPLNEDENTAQSQIPDDENETPEESGETKKQVTTYKASTYKVGADIPAGEYVLFNDSFSAYFEITSDSSGRLESILANENFDTHTIVTVADGQYFSMTGCYAIPIDECESVDFSGSGMFKVGYHIPSGEYKIEINEDAFGGLAYLEVSSNSTHSFESIVTNENFEGAKYITVSAGQYLTLTGCHIVNLPLRLEDLNMSKEEIVFLLMEDDYNGYTNGYDNMGIEIGDIWGNLSEIYSTSEDILSAAKEDYLAYANQEECVYFSFWEFFDRIYSLLENGRYEDIVISADERQNTLQNILDLSNAQ